MIDKNTKHLAITASFKGKYFEKNLNSSDRGKAVVKLMTDEEMTNN